MANTQIPDLPAAVALNGSEQLEIVQNGTSARTTTQDVGDLAMPYISNLQNYVDYLEKIPCASFYSTQTQTHGAIGAEALVTCNQVDFQNSISVVSNNRFQVDIAGIYNFQFSFITSILCLFIISDNFKFILLCFSFD